MLKTRVWIMLFIAVAAIAIVASLAWKDLHVVNPAEKSSVEELQALPYAQWSSANQNAKQRGVVVFDPGRASPGSNIFTDDVNVALLMDMKGQILHRWRLGHHKKCEYAQLLPNGDLIAVCMGQGLVKVDWESKRFWKRRMFVHHDVEPLPDGTFWTIIREMNREYRSRLVVFDCIQRVAAKGTLMEKWCTFDHLNELHHWHKPTALDEAAKTKTKKRFDYYHLNTVRLLPENPNGKNDPRFQKGNLLICLRNVNLVAILDKDTMKIVWGWGADTLDWPHMPTMLPSGNILVLDNGFHRKFSRILEMNPVSRKIVWTYGSDPKEKFFTALQGSVQRLPNGNTLICDSTQGRAFEIDSQKRVVWDFWNPEMKDGKRKTMYRLLRIPPETVPRFM